jgi:transposase
MPNASLVSIGVDVAKDKFDAAFLYEGDKSLVDTFENNKVGMRKFVRKLNKQKTASAVPCVLESTGLYHLNLALMVHQAGHQVNVINPLITKKYQQSSIRNAKTDTIDALRLAEIGIKESKLPVFSGNIQSIEAKKLIGYMAKLEEIKQQLSASRNQVTMMSGITGLTVNLDPTEEVIANLDKQMEVLEKRIVELAPPEAKTLSGQIHGLSHEKMAVVLSMLGDKHFTSRDQLVAFVGLDVMPRQSGTWRGKGRLSKRGNPYLRKVLYQVAWGLKQHNELYKKKYTELRAGGKNYVTTLLILARKFLRFLYAYYWKKTAYPQLTF